MQISHGEESARAPCPVWFFSPLRISPAAKITGGFLSVEAFFDLIRSKPFFGDGDEANGSLVWLDIGQTDAAQDQV